MFRAAMCPSSGELIVSIPHLVYVTLYRWLFGVQVWMRLQSSLIQTCTPNGHLWVQRDIYQKSYWYNWFSWWWAHGCPKHVENKNKHIWKRIVRQVGYLEGLYQDARSTEHKNWYLWFFLGDCCRSWIGNPTRTPRLYRHARSTEHIIYVMSGNKSNWNITFNNKYLNYVIFYLQQTQHT